MNVEACAAESVKTKLKRDERPHERAERNPKHKPRRASEDRGTRSVICPCAEPERERHRQGTEQRNPTRVHLAKRTRFVEPENVCDRVFEHTESMSDPLRSQQGDHDREADRRVTQDDRRSPLVPDGTSRIFIEQKIRPSVQPGNHCPQSNPEQSMTRQAGKNAFGERVEISHRVRLSLPELDQTPAA
jgi:hypothetical protein